MLVLSRKPGQQLVLPELGITLTLLAVSGGRVRLGVEAPPEVRVVRAELLRRPTRLEQSREQDPPR